MDAPDTNGPRPSWDAFVSYSSKDAVAIGRLEPVRNFVCEA
jgi:hypothetical protein